MRIRLFITIAVLLSVYVSASSQGVQLDGTLIHSGSVVSAHTPEMAFDDDMTTYFNASSSDFAWLGMDLGTPHVITSVGVASRNSNRSAGKLLLGVFEGANRADFMDAVPLYLISETPVPAALTCYDVHVSRAFRYVRYVGPSVTRAEVAELRFFGFEDEGCDTAFYQITSLPTVSIHVKNGTVPTSKTQDLESTITITYEDGQLIQEYPILTRVRGNFSASHENKPYRIKFNDGKSHHMLHGSPRDESPAKAKKWTLINNYGDKTLIRNNIAFEISRRAEMPYSPWCRNVDLLLNGEYRGTYQLTDWLGIDKNRVNITEMTSDDVEGEELTGGYFFEMNGYANSDPVHFTSSHGNPITVHSPEDDEIQSRQFDYIVNHFNEMEERVFSANYTDNEKGYRPLLDLDSFLRYFLTEEYVGNTDMIWQVFMYKERGDDRIFTGPAWDHDLGLDNDGSVYPGNQREGWTYTVRCAGNWGNFVSRILSDSRAMSQLRDMWTELRDKNAFNEQDMRDYVDSLRTLVSASARLNFIRWPYLTQKVHCNPAVWGTWDKEVDVVRDYVGGRVAWFDKKLKYNTLDIIDGVYHISSASELVTFSKMVNKGLTNVSVVLDADIDMAGFETRFAPIGSSLYPFSGHFDGKCHTISHLSLEGGDCVGLFGTVAGETTIENLIVEGHAQANNYVGGLVGYASGSSLTITACGSCMEVSATGSYAGGLIGSTSRTTITTIASCFSTGDVTASSHAGAIISNGGTVNITDSYNLGFVDGVSSEVFAAGSNLTTENCYDAHSTQVSLTTEEEAVSGRLCLVLNNGSSKSTPLWRQNIDNGRTPDMFPVPFKSHGAVYESLNGITNHNPNTLGYRYYLLEITEIESGGIVQLAEVDLLDETLSEYTDVVVLEGTESGIPNENWINIADNNLYTKYCGHFKGRTIFLFDAGEDICVSAYRLYTANDTQSNSGRNPRSWNLYAASILGNSVDDTDWLLLDSREDDRTMGATNYTPYDFYVTDPNDPNGFRFFMLELLEAQRRGTILQLAEIDLLNEAGEEYRGVTIYDAQCEYNSGEGWENLCDNNLETKWCGAFHDPAFFYFDAGFRVLPAAYRMFTANDTYSHPNRNPFSWRLWGSNVRSSQHDAEEWVLIDERRQDDTMEAANFTPYDFDISFDTGINDEIFDSEDETIYDLMGRRLNEIPTKGIYIKNGKKVLVR
ncbi:MAG: CotH kinase family protein [Bacteroidaceae bacterium]|nr:CotH kinase family protein [Bacteroidaceae bacterium]